jgi:NADH dehydrogenase
MALRSVTIFGGSGFLGRHLVRRLAKTGARITIAVRDPEAAKFLRPMGDVGQVTPMKVNILDDRSVAAAVEGAEAVVNLIGVLYESGRHSFQAVHAEAPVRMARAAKAVGAERFVHVSAIGANAAGPSTYARSKAAGEAGLLSAFPTATILRPSIVFGPEDNFFNQFAALGRLLPFLPLFGGGQSKFQPVYVGDVADALMAALTRADVAGRTFELGGPRVYSFKELMTLTMTMTGRRKPLVSIPFGLAAIQASVLELLPSPLLTRDQLKQLAVDNVVAPGQPGLAALDITPTAAEMILPTYLTRFKQGGRFAETAADL